MVVNLLNALQKENVSFELDIISWIGGNGDHFSVREAYKLLQPRISFCVPC